jgi:hypothetical protein
VALTREFKETIKERLRSDSVFFDAMFDEAVMAILNGEPHVAHIILADLSSCRSNFEKMR